MREPGFFPLQTLSDRITAALNTNGVDGRLVRESVVHRVTDAPGQPGYQRALNNFEIGGEYVFGTTCLFAPGQMQALLKLGGDDAQPELADVLAAYEIAEQAAPAGHEYLHGISYWLATGDHFYQKKSISLQVGAMEQYLTWLLKDKAAVIGHTNMVQLQAVFDQAQLGDEDPSFIQVGGIVPETIRAERPVPPIPEQPPEVVEVEERDLISPARCSLQEI